MDLLARREHLYGELAVKLGRHCELPELIDEVLAELVRDNLQSDRRYCDSYIRQRSARGYGPQRIRMELGQRGADAELVEAAMAAADCDWFAMARRVRTRKFGPGPPQDRRAESRQLRFLQYRGFGGDYARAAIGDS